MSVYPPTPNGIRTLYELLAERDPANFISHEKMPTIEEHAAFVNSLPFLHWLLIEIDGVYVGAIEANDRNELGVAVLKKCQRNGIGRAALKLFMEMHQPLPAVPAVRNGRWLANIAPGNRDSKRFFMTMGFEPIQETWRHG